MGIGQRNKEKNAITVTGRRCTLYVSIKLTLAGSHALEPLVIHIVVADTSAVLKPSTPRSATTDSAGLLKPTALCARHRIR